MRVYYFTRSGDCKKIANDISKQVNGSVYEIKDNKSWVGIIGFIKGGYYASSKKTIPVTYDKPDQNETVYLCTPVWASSFPPGVRTFIKEVKKENIILVASSSGNQIKDRDGFKKIFDIVGKDKNIKL